ncbi:membrane protein insertion efficiency factor YidD [Nocardia paucivorans]|uniref:membrane protein insertion efficiency factor YidD n=1 Tax=Nocardia paucivorans TaxID=114259 RepID=UPI000A048D89|nr:membrane protein insertion efficiency factor YidD [Nocardia paucivorans]
MSTTARLPANTLIFLIELYRTYVSPTRLPVCRFIPTCSEYAVTALRTRGLVVGLALTVVRLAKCAPWHPGGWDPVPPRRSNGPGDGGSYDHAEVTRRRAEHPHEHGDEALAESTSDSTSGGVSAPELNACKGSPRVIGDTNDGST